VDLTVTNCRHVDVALSVNYLGRPNHSLRRLQVLTFCHAAIVCSVFLVEINSAGLYEYIWCVM